MDIEPGFAFCCTANGKELSVRALLTPGDEKHGFVIVKTVTRIRSRPFLQQLN